MMVLKKSLMVIALSLTLMALMWDWSWAKEPNASKQSTKLWLVEVIDIDNFSIKFYLTEKILQPKAYLMASLLKAYPNGSSKNIVELSADIKSMLEQETDFYVEAYHKNKLIFKIDDKFPIRYPRSTDQARPKVKQSPKAECQTYKMYLNLGAASSLAGCNLYFAICPKKVFFAYYLQSCSDWSSSRYWRNGYADYPSENNLKAISTCDGSLDYYHGLAHAGLPRPLRFIVFDEKKWRADRPGELSDFYFAHARAVYFSLLDEATKANLGGFKIDKNDPINSLASFKISPNGKVSQAEASKRGRALMAAVSDLKESQALLKNDFLDIPWMVYALLMMGVEEAEVKKFFLGMMTEYKKHEEERDAYFWLTIPAEEVFVDIALAVNGFDPIKGNQSFQK